MLTQYFFTHKIWHAMQNCDRCVCFLCPMPIDDQKINDQKLSTIKKLTVGHTAIIMLIACSSMDDNQDQRRSFTLKSKLELIEKLKAAENFLLHWMKLVKNLSLTADTLVNGRSSWTMCLT